MTLCTPSYWKCCQNRLLSEHDFTTTASLLSEIITCASILHVLTYNLMLVITIIFILEPTQDVWCTVWEVVASRHHSFTFQMWVSKFILNWYFLSTCLGFQHDIYFLKWFLVPNFVIFVCRWIYRSEVYRILSVWRTLLSGEYTALKIKYRIIFIISEGRNTRWLEETAKWRAPHFVLFVKYYNFKEDERGGAYETYGKYEKYVHSFGWKA